MEEPGDIYGKKLKAVKQALAYLGNIKKEKLDQKDVDALNEILKDLKPKETPEPAATITEGSENAGKEEEEVPDEPDDKKEVTVEKIEVPPPIVNAEDVKKMKANK